MDIEYEATFPEIDKTTVRERLVRVGAELVKPEFLQKRVVFHLPKGHEVPGGWLRVRDESDRITLSLKIVDGNRITNQKELLLGVSDFESAVNLLLTLGCIRKSYQETKRELWRIDGVEVTLDEWPFLKPFVEIEGVSEAMVHRVAEKLGFEYDQAVFGAVDVMYMRQYPHLTADRINNQTPLILFEGENPFLDS
ncbi:MAG: CYTH domain-containing protein [Candidatus Moranbacteria bacterium]|jgi:adenylate cyclase class 2|nr:CYTH domain-containing protein [Candidatus Moranbacteria bacterium]